MTREMIGAAVIVMDKKKRILLGKRKNNYFAGSFGFPGGQLELKEKLTECVQRELYEEAKMQAKELHYLGIVRELQKTYTFIHFFFLCKQYSGKPQIMEPEKCESWDWYDLDNLPENLLPGHAAAIDILNHPKDPALRDLV
jgi:8-oxo-dGTP diphosphatase